MIRLFTLIILVLIGSHIQAQISHGGKPFDWEENHELLGEFISLPPINRELLDREDAINDASKEIPYRFGDNIPVDLDINNSGEWTTLENGDRVWRLGIIAEGAVSLNFVFDQYHLPKGGKIFVYDTDKKQLLGSFTSQNASKDNKLGVGFVLSDRIIISYHEPENVVGQGYLHINNITHGYRNAFVNTDELAKSGPFGTSGACNVNVNCPEGLPYGIQKRSAGLIVLNGNSKCSGALVNTTAQDGRPYFLTARHCATAQGTNMDSTWVFYFNFETPDCEGQGVAPINQSVSGATLLAKNNESDFALLELNNAVPVDYNVCYSGWDATDNASTLTSAYGIHHPKGDVKKISIENDAPSKATLGGFANQVWFINHWEVGVTEGGSSGSPLFNQSGLIIGQLAGGTSQCIGTVGNGGFDFYGRIGVSWNYGATPATRLKDWLDPINSGEMILGNSCTGLAPVNDASLAEMIGISYTTCDLEPLHPSINVLNSGSELITSLTLEIEINGVISDEINWTGNIDVFSSAFIDLGSINPISGNNILTVRILSVNGEPDTIPSGNIRTHEFYGFDNTEEVSLQLTLDNYPLETSWSIEYEGDILYAGQGTYELPQVLETICLGVGCYKFIIKDTSGDGICCSYGQGSYLLSGESGNTLASGGNFTSSETTQFCITTVNNIVTEKEFIHVFPNPTSGNSHIVLGDTANSIKSISIVDALGKTLLRDDDFRSETRVWTFEGDRFGAGIYFVLIESSFRTDVKRIVVIR